MLSSTITRRRVTAVSVSLLLTVALFVVATASDVDPEFTDAKNPKCSDYDFQYDQTWSELKVDPPAAGTFVQGNLTFTITNLTDKSFDWTSDPSIDAVIVKAGRLGSHVYIYDPEETADDNLSSPGPGNQNAISHISVCWDDDGGGQEQALPDVALFKTADDAAVYAGGQVGFTLTVESFGLDPATDVFLEDPLPPLADGWSIDGLNASSCSISLGVLNCSFPFIDPFDFRQVHVFGNATGQDCGPLENVAVAKAPGDIDPSNNEASASTFVLCSDVAVQKTASTDEVIPGETVGFTLVLSSLGPDNATGVTLSDALPAITGGWSLGGADAASCSIVNGTLSCEFGTVAVGDTRTVTLTGQADVADCGWIQNTATGDADVDIDPSNNADSAQTYVRCADVSVEKTADQLEAIPGEEIAFTLVVTSHGPDAADNVSLFDPLPSLDAGWALGGANATDCTLTNGTLSCDFGTLAADDSRTVSVSGTAGVPDCGAVDNAATVTAALDIDPSNNAAFDSSYIACSDVSVEKTPDDAQVVPGDALGFSIVVESHGPDPATNVTLEDALPALDSGWSLSGPDAADCGIASGTLSCDFGTLGVGQTRTIHLDGVAQDEDCGFIDNLVTVSADEDINGSNDHDEATIYVYCSDVSVDKTADDDLVTPGEDIEFILVLHSSGPDAAENATLSDSLPAIAGGWSLSGLDASFCGIDNGTLSCDFGTVGAGESRTVVLSATAEVADCGWIDNSAIVDADVDIDPGNNFASDSVYVYCSDVSVEKTADAALVVPGDALGFTLFLESHGPDHAQDVTLSDSLPTVAGGWTLSGPDAADCGIASGTLSCDFGTVVVGDSREVHLEATASAADCGIIDNAASVAAAVDIDPSNNADSDSLYVYCSEISMEKTAGQALVVPGDDVVFDLTLESHGPDDAEDVTLSDSLPTVAGGWTLSGPDAADCGIANGTLSCDFGIVAAGDSRSVTLTATASADDCGFIDNTASVSADVDLNSNDNTDSDSIYVYCSDVSVEKTADAALVVPGDSLGFTLLLESHGPDDAEDVTLSDSLPTVAGGWTLGGADAADCGIANGTLSCDFGTVAVGDSREVHLEATASTADCGFIDNAASVAAAVDIDPSNNADSDSLYVYCSDVSVEKTADAPEAIPGDEVSFTLVVSSHGPDDAENVTLDDPLPTLDSGWSLSGPDAGDCSIDNGTLSCDFGTVDADDSRTVIVSGTAAAPDCGAVDNAGTVGADVDTDASNNSAFDSTYVSCSDVSLEKTPDADTVFPGEPVGFTLTLTSHGPDPATNVTLSDPLPTIAGGWTLGGTDSADCSIDNGTLSCDFGTVGVGQEREVRLTSTAEIADCGLIPNDGWVSASEDINQSNDAASASIYVHCSDVSVKKTADAAQVGVGEASGFNLTLESHGPDDATNVTLTDDLPDVSGGWTLGGADASDCGIDNGTLSCDFGTVEVGDDRQVHLSTVAQAAECGFIDNTAFAHADGDINAANNTDSDSYEVHCPDVAVEKTAWDTLIGGGEQAAFTIIVTSLGPGDATNVSLEDPLPALNQSEWSLSGPDAAHCEILDDNLSCFFGDLAAGESRTVNITAITCREDCGDLVNVATVHADSDANLTNNQDSATITVSCICPHTIGFWKTHPDEWAVDELVLGDEVYSKQELMDILWSSTRGDASIILAHQLIAAKLSLAWGAADVDEVEDAITEADAVLATYDGKLPYQVKGNKNPDKVLMVGLADILDAYNNGVLVAGCDSDIEVSKDAADSRIEAGEEASFTIVVSVNGPGAATGVSLTDELPPLAGGWTLSGPDAGDCELSAGVVSCSFLTVEAGDTRTITVSGLTSPDDVGPLDNTAVALTGSLGDDPENNSDFASILVLAPRQ